MLRFACLITVYPILSFLFLTNQEIFFWKLNHSLKNPNQDYTLLTPKHSPEKSYEEVILLPNENHPYNFTSLQIDETSDLNLSKYSCAPESFGYSVSEGKLVFPDFEYPACSTITGISDSLLSLNRTSNTISMNCPEDKSGYYFQGPLHRKNLMLKPSVKDFKLLKYQLKPVKPSSFGLGFCSNKSFPRLDPSDDEDFKLYDIDPKEIQHADMAPIFDQQLFDRNLKTLNGTKPKIIFLLTLDSLSRRHFYRKLPKIVKFLNESQDLLPHMAVYDFLMHSTFGDDSVHNQIPIFGGVDYMNKLHGKEGKDLLGKNAIWSDLKKKGFLTFMGFDDCDKWFPRILGEDLNIDYAIRQFYCLVDVYGGVKTEKVNVEQRCLGPHQTHVYMLNYTLRLVEMYKETNMWIYLHLNAGHERTGQHAATLDSDITSFLQDFFEMTKNFTEVFLFLHADHGMRYGDWYNSLDAYKETTLPSMFVISDKSLLDQFPFSYHALEENRKRFTSKPDIRKTILSLVGIQENNRKSIDWLSEIANYSRNCEDLKSDMLFCPCSNFYLLKNYRKIIKNVLKIIRQRTEEEVNKLSYNFPLHPQGKYCDRVKLDRLDNVYHLSVNKTHEIFKIEFGTNSYKQLKLQVNVLISLKGFYVQGNYNRFPTFDIVAKRKNYKATIMSMGRLDKYGGPCQSIAESHGVPPEFCVRTNCKSNYFR